MKLEVTIDYINVKHKQCFCFRESQGRRVEGMT